MKMINEKLDGFQTASHLHQQEISKFYLRSGIEELDNVLGKGIQPGKIIEWGIPHGVFGRMIAASFLKNETPSALWIYADFGLSIYAPSWASHGINLDRVFFSKCDEPIKYFKPVFLNDAFKIIILDCPKKFTKADIAFLVARARINQQIIFLIRNYFLSPKQGNPLVQYRINCERRTDQRWLISFVKGGVLKEIILSENQVCTDV